MTSTAYGLELQSRALCPLYHESLSSQDCHRFLVGTSSSSQENKIHLLEYYDETKSLDCTSVWSHSDAILGIWCSPSISDRTLFATASTSKLRVLQVADSLASGPKEVYSLAQNVHQVLWDLEGLQNELKTVRGNKLITTVLDASKMGAETASYTASSKCIVAAALDPHHASQCLLACGLDGLQMVDSRQKTVYLVDGTTALHGFGGVCNVDFSPSKPNEILTCGTDGTVLIHDLRMAGKTFSLHQANHLMAHDHAVQRACFNPFHNDLILTGSTDQSVKLWDVDKDEKFVCLKQLSDFGESVMDICWSSNGPWVFAGISINGKVLVDNVPNEKKMSILLEEKK